MCLRLGYVVSSNSNISELHRECRRLHGSSQRFRTAAHRLKTASFIVNTPYRCFTHATGHSPARRSAISRREKMACQQQSRHAHLDDRCLGKKLIGRTCCSCSPKPQIAIDSARSVSWMSISFSIRCTFPPSSCVDARVDSVSFARCSSMVPGLPVRSPFDGGGLCGGCVPACRCFLRILRKSMVWRSHPVSHQRSHWSSFRVGIANVPHFQKPTHIRCRDELFAELVQPSHLDFRQPCPSRILRQWAIDERCKHRHEGLSHLVPLLPSRRLAVCRSLRLGCCERLE